MSNKSKEVAFNNDWQNNDIINKIEKSAKKNAYRSTKKLTTEELNHVELWQNNDHIWTAEKSIEKSIINYDDEYIIEYNNDDREFIVDYNPIDDDINMENFDIPMENLDIPMETDRMVEFSTSEHIF